MTAARTCALLALVALPVAMSAAPDAKYKAPRTESGQPDLRGIWNFSSDVPLERPSSFADRKFFTRDEIEAQRAATEKALKAVATFAPVEDVGLTWLDHTARTGDLRTSIISYPENGRVPPLVEGVRRVPGPQDFIAALTDPKGAPPLPELAAALLGEAGETAPRTSRRPSAASSPRRRRSCRSSTATTCRSCSRTAITSCCSRTSRGRSSRIHGRPHVGDTLRSWSGDSRGHWEGDSLVIETRNFNGRTRSFAGAGNARDKSIVERFTRQSASVIGYEATIVDPKTFTDRIVLSFPMARVDSRVYESACHEHNYSLSNSLSAARAEEAAATKIR